MPRRPRGRQRRCVSARRRSLAFAPHWWPSWRCSPARSRSRSASRSASHATRSTACCHASTSSWRRPKRAIADEAVFDEGGMRERIAHEPLGVVANISAWNYPYFVGCERVRAGAADRQHRALQAVGVRHADRPAHRAPAARGGRAGAVFMPGGRRRRRRRGAAGPASRRRVLHRQPRHRREDRRRRSPPALREAAARARRQGSDLRRATTSTPRPPPRAWPTAPSTTPGRAAARSSASTCTRSLHEPSSRPSSRRVRGFKRRRPDGPPTPTSAPLTRAPQLDVLDAQVADAAEQGRHAAVRRQARLPGPGQLLRADGADRTSTTTMEVMRDESFGPIIGIQTVRRRRRGGRS